MRTDPGSLISNQVFVTRFDSNYLFLYMQLIHMYLNIMNVYVLPRPSRQNVSSEHFTKIINSV